jgi:hypothetical protein
MSLRSILFIAAVTITWNTPASAAGCQYDMQCKGDRICQQGQCMAPDGGDDSDGPSPKAQPAQPTVKLSPAPTSAPRGCCTVAGKLRLAPAQSGDPPMVVGDTCQGLTSSGKPIPGTACN